MLSSVKWHNSVLRDCNLISERTMNVANAKVINYYRVWGNNFCLIKLNILLVSWYLWRDKVGPLSLTPKFPNTKHRKRNVGVFFLLYGYLFSAPNFNCWMFYSSIPTRVRLCVVCVHARVCITLVLSRHISILPRD